MCCSTAFKSGTTVSNLPLYVCGRSNCSTNVHFHILCNATLCGKRISSLLCYEVLSLILFILPNHWYTILLLTHPEALFLLFSFPPFPSPASLLLSSAKGDPSQKCHRDLYNNTSTEVTYVRKRKNTVPMLTLPSFSAICLLSCTEPNLRECRGRVRADHKYACLFSASS